MTLAPGSKIGLYEIVAPLGAGGMGEVYRARDTRLGREVALKTLPAQVALEPDLLRRFEDEAKTVARLNHPNIVTLHTIEEAEGIRFLTMELVEGLSLAQLLAPGGLPFYQVLDLALSLTDALVAAHEKGIVHRDLKPSNVMVTKDGRLKILDFGLAKLAVSGGAKDLEVTQGSTMTSPLTNAGQVVGTVPYMAPEQLRGEAMDERTDLFAVGVMLYELVTGQRPFTGTSLLDVGSAIMRDTPAPVVSLRKDVPAVLARVVERCLEKDPAQRYPDAREMHKELRLLRHDLEAGTVLAGALASIPADMLSIAVLPFVNMSKDEENEYFADGLSEELLNVLAKIRGLRVASRTSAFHFKGKDVDLVTVAQKLNVATILEGSVRKAGKRVRITAQLIQVATDSHLWSQTYDRELEDIFAVQIDIAQSVVKELRMALLGEEPGASASAAATAEVRAAVKGRGENAEAYRLYLQGQFFLDRDTGDDVEKAIGYYRQAVELDPGFALAWASLSRAYDMEAGEGWAPPAVGFRRSREAAERALMLEPELAEGHAALGSVRMNYDWDWRGAEASFRRALELAPGNAKVVLGVARLAANLGRLDEAIMLHRRGVTLDPLSVAGHRNLGRYCRDAGLLEAAEEALEKALELSPHVGWTHFDLGLVYLVQRRMEKALAAFEGEPFEPFHLLGLALVYHALGRSPESDAALRKLIEKYAEPDAYQIAEAYAYRGEGDRAFEWLERAYAQRDSGLAGAKGDLLLRHLHPDPRWQPFLKKMGLAG